MTPEDLLRLGIRVSLIPMEGQTRGMTIELLNGYLILINEALCDQAKWRTFMHELKHIIKDDFHGEQLVSEIERRPGV